MDALYHEELIEHYKYPRNKGHIVDPDITYTDKNPLCGDVCTIDLRVKEGKIDEVKFIAEGCAISQAATSMLTEMISGKTLEECKQFNKQDILNALGIKLGPVRLKCALLCLKVLKAGAYGIKEWPT